MNHSTNVSPIGDFQRNVPEFVRRLRSSGLPEVLTIEGRGAIVVQDAEAYQRLLEVVEQAEAMVGIRRGLADLEAGRHVPLQEFEDAMREKYGIPKNA